MPITGHQRRIDVDALRSRYWLGGVAIRLRPTSLHDLARMVEPNLRWRNETTGVSSWTNKWRAYERGERAPRLALIDKVEALRVNGTSGTGSKAEFSHVLWQILREPEPTPQTCKRWMQLLDRPIASGSLILSGGETSRYAIPSLRPRHYEKLWYRPSLDTLALLTYVVQQAHRFRYEALAHEAGQNLVTTLWQLSLRFDDRQMLPAFMAFFERWVLPLTKLNGVRVGIGREIEKRAAVLRDAVRAFDQFRTRPSDNADIDIRLRHILGGRWRSEHRLAYASIRMSTPELVATTEEREECRRSSNNQLISLYCDNGPAEIPRWIQEGWRPY
ncbi:hypothetical protein [Variovorax sp. E3]|uniref:hypothetical protein n=1 Tax=Variovorax sp. E3 TaxID=1914993 RepID=UPI0018DBDE4F|nr:hypothetical protein [Variovorax sp. E3]